MLTASGSHVTVCHRNTAASTHSVSSVSITLYSAGRVPLRWLPLAHLQAEGRDGGGSSERRVVGCGLALAVTPSAGCMGCDAALIGQQDLASASSVRQVRAACTAELARACRCGRCSKLAISLLHRSTHISIKLSFSAVHDSGSVPLRLQFSMFLHACGPHSRSARSL